MDKTVKTRRYDIDFLKGLSIIAVVLYHIGLLDSGYLGVDAFFVIAGFLSVPKIVKQICDNHFSYIKFIWSRVIRLLPLVLLGSAVCLVIGFFFWLPDDYENLSQSVIASTAFCNNILSAITTKNYWDSINDYKPLMHMWYLGILMQFYLSFPIIAWILKKCASFVNASKEKVIYWGFFALTIVSLILFFLPNFSVGNKFYMLPFRFFELMIGGLIAVIAPRVNLPKKATSLLSGISLFAILGLFCISLLTFNPASIGVETIIIGKETATSTLLLPNAALVPLTVLMTSALLLVSKDIQWFGKLSPIIAIGKRSFSIFVYHQIILAIYRCSISSALSVWFILAFITLLAILTELSYRFIEEKFTAKLSLVVILSACLVCAFAGYIYIIAGVVRDVPELGIRAADAHRGMYAEYCDRIYDYDKEFEQPEKINVLVIGNSFARDFGNVLLESEFAKEIELSYAFEPDPSLTNRIKQADKIFIFLAKDKLPEYFWSNVKDTDQIYGIGTKNFGVNNGQIYAKRFSDDYFSSTVPLDPGYKALNDELKAQWGDNYIDMLAVVTTNQRVKVFTDTNMYISQDTRHLTQAGAQYYAKLLNLESILF